MHNRPRPPRPLLFVLTLAALGAAAAWAQAEPPQPGGAPPAAVERLDAGAAPSEAEREVA